MGHKVARAWGVGGLLVLALGGCHWLMESPAAGDDGTDAGSSGNSSSGNSSSGNSSSGNGSSGNSSSGDGSSGDGSSVPDCAADPTGWGAVVAESAAAEPLVGVAEHGTDEPLTLWRVLQTEPSDDTNTRQLAVATIGATITWHTLSTGFGFLDRQARRSPQGPATLLLHRAKDDRTGTTALGVLVFATGFAPAWSVPPIPDRTTDAWEARDEASFGLLAGVAAAPNANHHPVMVSSSSSAWRLGAPADVLGSLWSRVETSGVADVVNLKWEWQGRADLSSAADRRAWLWSGPDNLVTWDKNAGRFAVATRDGANWKAYPPATPGSPASEPEQLPTPAAPCVRRGNENSRHLLCASAKAPTLSLVASPTFGDFTSSGATPRSVRIDGAPAGANQRSVVRVTSLGQQVLVALGPAAGANQDNTTGDSGSGFLLGTCTLKREGDGDGDDEHCAGFTTRCRASSPEHVETLLTAKLGDSGDSEPGMFVVQVVGGVRRIVSVTANGSLPSEP